MSLSTPAISLIVPYYQVAPFFRPCLDSALAQTFTDFELLLVGGDSTDGSEEIAAEYAMKDSRVRLVRRKGGGIGAARTSGLAGARGEWIAWLDGDDLLTPDALKILYDAAMSHKADMAMGAYVECHDTGRIHFHRPVFAKGAVLRGSDEIQRYFLTSGRFLNHMWTKMIRRSCWEGVVFPEGRIYEDMAVAPDILERVSSCVVVNKPVYRYQVRPSSLSTGKNVAKQLDGLAARAHYVAFMRAHHPELVPLANDGVLAFGVNLMAKIEHVGIENAPEVWQETLATMRGALGEAAMQNVLYYGLRFLLLHRPRLLARLALAGLKLDKMI